VRRQQQILEGLRAGQRTRHRRRHAQFDQQRNQNQLWVSLRHTLTLPPGPGPRVPNRTWFSYLHRTIPDGNPMNMKHETYNQSMPFASVKKVAEADFPTRWGQFRILGFEGLIENPAACNDNIPAPAVRIESAVALVMGDIHAEPPIVRIHSQCLTGDVFHSLRCDCRQQFELAMATITDAGAGIMLYEQQEGRGIGLMAKLRAYELQDQGRDTIEANLELGYEADCRHFELPAQILKHMGIEAVRLITNNPEKVEALELAGVKVVERISAEVPSEPTNARYLQTKREKMGHLVS